MRDVGDENNFLLAIRAPSASAWSFAHTILGWISLEFAKFANPPFAIPKRKVAYLTLLLLRMLQSQAAGVNVSHAPTVK